MIESDEIEGRKLPDGIAPGDKLSEGNGREIVIQDAEGRFFPEFSVKRFPEP